MLEARLFAPETTRTILRVAVLLVIVTARGLFASQSLDDECRGALGREAPVMAHVAAPEIIPWSTPFVRPDGFEQIALPLLPVDEWLWTKTREARRREVGLFELIDDRGRVLHRSPLMVGTRHSVPFRVIDPVWWRFRRGLISFLRVPGDYVVRFTHTHPHTGLTYEGGAQFGLCDPTRLSGGDLRCTEKLRYDLSVLLFNNRLPAEVRLEMVAFTKKEAQVRDWPRSESLGEKLKFLLGLTPARPIKTAVMVEVR